MKYEVIIANRNDPDLKHTIASIKENSRASGIIVVEDKDGDGPQACRHRGIMSSKADVVIVVDAHMRFTRDALDGMAWHAYRSANSVNCATCFISKSPNDFSVKPYRGARFELTSEDQNGTGQVLPAKWRKSDGVGMIGAVMGACYAFRRDWYVDGLREPWKMGTGWGMDEEIISAATWLRGGVVECLPYWVWHRLGNGHSIKYTKRQLDGVVANRMRMLDVMPMPQAEKRQLWEVLKKGIDDNQFKRALAILAESAEWRREYFDFLRSGPIGWNDFKRDIVGEEEVTLTARLKMSDLKKKAKEMGLKMPFSSTKEDIILAITEAKTEARTGVVEAKKAETTTLSPPPANWGPREHNMAGKRCCPHCGSEHTTVVTVRPKAGIVRLRYRNCDKCGQNFPTREVDAQ